MHQSGSVHVTTHRLFYLDGIDDLVHSFAFGLEHVNRTDFYGGLFTSSAKVTLFLNPLENTQSGSSGLSDSDQAVFVAWECHVCGNKNAPGLSPQAATICGLCGIPRDDSSSSPPVPTPQKAPLSSSLPSTSFSSPALPVSQTTADEDDEGGINIKREPIPCPACTFLNHPYLRTCEICDTELPKPSRGPMKSAPSSRPVSPPVDLDDAESESRRHIIKISFRKGGEKQFYASLKLCLQRKGWASQGVNKRRSMPNLARNSGDEGIRSGISQ
jgi:ESCRT-II complex subunit VPS36